MKITAIETYPVGAGWKNWLFVRVMTDEDGLYGVSEATINGFIKTTEAAISELAHLAIGRDPRNVNAIAEEVIGTVQDAGTYTASLCQRSRWRAGTSSASH